MTEENKNYQLTCLFSPQLDQKKIGEIGQRIKKLIIEKGGSLPEKEFFLVSFKKRLAYPIKKYQEAFHSSFSFFSSSQTLQEINQQLNSEKDILRYLIVNKPKVKTKPIKEKINYKLAHKIEPLIAQEIPLTDKKVQPGKTAEKGKVKIEELDKKLEEILNQ